MSKMFTRSAAAALLAGAMFQAMPASAQQVTYCNGRLAADSFYSTTRSDGTRSVVEHFLQLRNTTGSQVRYTVTMRATQLFNRPQNQNGTLGAWASARIALGEDRLNNPSGAGALQQVDLRDSTVITCH